MDQSDSKHVETIEHTSSANVHDVKTLKEPDLVELEHSYKEGKMDSVGSVTLVRVLFYYRRVINTN